MEAKVVKSGPVGAAARQAQCMRGFSVRKRKRRKSEGDESFIPKKHYKLQNIS